jgi:hypothetical protein
MPYFSTLSHKQHDFREGEGGGAEIITEHKMCVLIFSTNFSEKVAILLRTERNIITIHRPSYNVPVILVRFYES